MNKLTDSEIEKAFECCIFDECENCPHDEETACKENLNQEVLDLIDRQKAEIENHNVEVNKKVAEIEALTDKLNATIAGQETLQKALVEKNAEIERLKKEVEYWKLETKNARADLNQSTAEAVKEFAERLKEEQSFYDGQETRIYLTEKDLDNLVKEMVGDAE